MKLLFYILISISITGLFGCKQDVIDPKLVESINISSRETGLDYTISIQLPESFYTSTNNYPSLYVLDAEEDEKHIAKLCDKISKDLQKQNVIVIGIKYQKGNHRSTDYTPTATNHGKGGSAQFLSFIQYELIPKIESEFRADTIRSRRTILGHSFGGLLGAYALTKHNDVFGNYLLLSPSLFYDNSIVLQYEKEARPFIKEKPQLVFISLGGTERGLIPGNEYLSLQLKNFYSLTKSDLQLIPGKGHLASKKQSIENALTFYFKNRSL